MNDTSPKSETVSRNVNATLVLQLSQLLEAAQLGIITDAVIIFGDPNSFNVAVTAQNLVLYHYACLKAAELLDKSIMQPEKPKSSIIPVKDLAGLNLKG